LLQAHSEGVLELVTSSVTLEELEKHESEEKREPLLDIYRLLRKITFVAEDDLLWQTIGRPGQSRVYGPLPVKAADLERLKTILPDADDARHLFQAARNGIDYFVTGDQDTILKHWEEVEIAVSIRVCSPSDLVYELGL
jgi:predicted nucleic acid-binding protein